MIKQVNTDFKKNNKRPSIKNIMSKINTDLKNLKKDLFTKNLFKILSI